jgi:hypothetical protein
MQRQKKERDSADQRRDSANELQNDVEISTFHGAGPLSTARPRKHSEEVAREKNARWRRCHNIAAIKFHRKPIVGLFACGVDGCGGAPVVPRFGRHH